MVMVNRTTFRMSKRIPRFAPEQWGDFLRWSVSAGVVLSLLFALEAVEQHRMTPPGGPVAAQVEWVRLKTAGPAARASIAPSSLPRRRSATNSATHAALPLPPVNRNGASAGSQGRQLRERIGQGTLTALDVNPLAEAARVQDGNRKASQSQTNPPPGPSSAVGRPVATTIQEPPATGPAPNPEDRETRTLPSSSATAMFPDKAPLPLDSPVDAREGAADAVNAGDPSAAPPPVPKEGEPGPARQGKPEPEGRLSPFTVSLLDLDAGFRLLTPVRPRFPQRAARAQRSGQVQLEVLVDADGTVAQVEVVGEPEGWGFGLAAREAFAQARFTPPTASGRPVRVRWRKTLLFRP